MDETRRLLNRRNDDGVSRGKLKAKVAQGCILVTLALERMAFYSLTGNLVLFLNSSPFSWQSYNALYSVFIFMGISYVMSFVGGILADAALGKSKTLFLSFLIYFIGYVFLPIVTKNDLTMTSINNSYPDICGVVDTHKSLDVELGKEYCANVILCILVVIAVGSGIFRSVIAPFGADQVKGEGAQASLAFFNWYYWSINIGTLVALSVITYVQQDQNFFYGFLSSNISLLVAVIVFMIGCCAAVHNPKTGSILKDIVKILMESCRRRKLHRTKSENVEEISNEDTTVDVPELRSTEEAPSFLDNAKYRYGGSFHETAVDDVKQLWKILCVFLTLLPYWMVYFQMQTTFELQGLHMKLNFNKDETVVICSNNFSSNSDSNSKTQSTTVVAAWFSLFDVIFLIILLPLFDRIIYPFWAKRGQPVGMVFRISLGMMFATCAVLVAGIVELFRLKAVWPHPSGPTECCSKTINQTIGHTMYHAADMNVFWQIPQYALIGISEVFASVAALEFAYQMAPKSMKSIIMGFFYLFTGIGSLLGTATMYAFKGTWFFTEDFGNINCRLPCSKEHNYHRKSCHLDYYFFFLAGLEFVGMFVFIIVAHSLKLSQHLVAVSRTQATQARMSHVADRSFVRSGSRLQKVSVNRYQK